MTQREEVLSLLRMVGQRGVCVSEAPEHLAYTLRNRVGDLVRDGHRITAMRCTTHSHRGNVARYVLVAPVQAEAPSAPAPAPEVGDLFPGLYARRGNAL